MSKVEEQERFQSVMLIRSHRKVSVYLVYNYISVVVHVYVRSRNDITKHIHKHSVDFDTPLLSEASLIVEQKPCVVIYPFSPVIELCSFKKLCP